jgi:aerobic carbon-monoxide dehydrogenase small subunit
MLLDGEPVRSCLIFAVEAHGRQLRTVERLARGGKLHPLQQAFWNHHALQLAFARRVC